MTKNGQPYTSGAWVVKAGCQDEFVARWTEFTEWSRANASGAMSFVLISDTTDPRRFLSLGAWRDAEAVRAWRERPEFQRRLAACRELCEDFRGGDYTLSSAVGI